MDGQECVKTTDSAVPDTTEACTHAHSVCGGCESQNECGRLSMALAILEGQGLSDRKKQRQASAIERFLVNCGFGFPWADKVCTLANQPQVVRSLTDKLIALLSKGTFARGAKTE